MLRKLIEPKCVVHGEFSEEVSESYKLFGSVLLSIGEDEKALKALNKVILYDLAYKLSIYLFVVN